MTVLEKTIEKRVNEYAQTKGWLVYKFVSPNKRGLPDRIYLRNGIAMFIEFKQRGKKPSALQLKEIDKLRKEGFNVRVVDNVLDGKDYFDLWD